MRTSLDVASQALVLIGANPIASFEEGSTEATACTLLYEPCVQDLLCQHRWRFAAGQVELVLLEDGPEGRWNSYYQLPTTLLDLHTITVGDVPIDYQRYGDKVACDAGATETLIADGTFRVAESTWPPYFATLAQVKLAGQLALSVAAQQDLAVSLEQQASVIMMRARHLDAVAHTSRALPRGRLSRFRSGMGSIPASKIGWYE